MKQASVRPIARLRRTFPNEWLLIEVRRFDPHTTTPVTGRLVAHAKLRDSLEARASQAQGLLYLVHGSDTLPHGYAAAF